MDVVSGGIGAAPSPSFVELGFDSRIENAINPLLVLWNVQLGQTEDC